MGGAPPHSLDEDQAQDVVSIPLQGKSSIADHMVIASGRSTRQVASMATKLAEKIKALAPGMDASFETMGERFETLAERPRFQAAVLGSFGLTGLLLAAWVRALTQVQGHPACRLLLESHGREGLAGVDVSRTVGWFTAELPVLLNLEGVRGPGEALVAVKEQLRRIPAGGLGYGLLRYLRPGEEVAERLRALPRPQVLFNYLGQLGDGRDGKGSLFTRAPEDGGPTVDPRGTRSHLLQIDCSVADGRLRAEWAYSADRHRRETVEGLARGFFAAIETLIEHCRMPGAGAYTPSDFPDADLGDDDFASLMDRLSRAE